MNKRFLIALGLLLTLLLVACNESAPNETEAQNIKEIVHDYSVGNFANVNASITSHELIVTDEDNKETSYNLPEE